MRCDDFRRSDNVEDDRDGGGGGFGLPMGGGGEIVNELLPLRPSKRPRGPAGRTKRSSGRHGGFPGFSQWKAGNLIARW